MVRVRYESCMALAVVVTLVCILAQQALADEVIMNKKERKQNSEAKTTKEQKTPVDKSNKPKIIRQFFESQGIGLDEDQMAEQFVSRYDDDVISKMVELQAVENDYYTTYNLIGEINNMIYNGLTKSKSLKVEAPFELADEAILQALDLIVPDSEDEQFYSLAKKDLRDFFLKHPDLGRELIERISVPLDMGELQTKQVVDFLHGAYYNWIPLARLADFIEENGTPDQA